MSDLENTRDAFKPCKWFEDKIRSGMRIGNTYYSLLRHQGKVHIYDATDKIYKLILIVSNIDEANEWLKQEVERLNNEQ